MHLRRRPEQHAALITHPAPPASAHTRLVRSTRAAAILLLCSALPTFAQSPVTGAVHGVIHDPEGRPAASTSITLSDAEHHILRRAATARDGTFLLPELAPGTYTLAFRPAHSKAPASEQPTTIRLGETEELQLTLRPEVAGTTVTVQSEDTPPPSATGRTITRPELTEVPTENLRWKDFALLTPGVAPDRNGDSLVSVHGLEPNQNALLIDGVDDTQNYNAVPNGTGSDNASSPDDDSDAAEHTAGPGEGQGRGRSAGAAYGFSLSAVREFRISTQGYSALSGHAAGGVITTVSRTGSDRFHGSASFVLRSSALAARNPLSIATSYNNGVITSAIVKPHDLRENLGFTLGGPVLRFHAARFFYSFDQQRRGFPAISSPADPNFYRLTAIQQTLLANRGVSAAQTNAALNFLSSLTGSTPRRQDQTINFVRLDWQARPRIGTGFEYNRLRYNNPAGLVTAPVVARARASLGNASGSVDTVLARLTTSAGNRFVNELRAAWTHDLQFETAQPPLPQEPAISPPATNGQAQAPEVVIGPNGLLFGTPANLSNTASPDEQTVQLNDTVSLVLGKHLLQFGGSFARIDEQVASLANAAGSFHYDARTTSGHAGGIVDFITDQAFSVNSYPNGGCPSIYAARHLFCFTIYTQSFGEQSVRYTTQDFAGFAQDTWRPHPRLTLNAGVRYEYTLLPIPTTPNPALDALFSTLPGAGGATSTFPEDRNNFGPRIGLSWQPFGARGGRIRAGYGIFFGRLPGATVRAALTHTALPQSVTRIRTTPSTVIDCPQVANQGFGYPCAFLTQPYGTAANTSAMLFDRRFRLPTIQQASLSYERDLTRRINASIGTIADLDRQLPGSTDLNIAPSVIGHEFQLQGGTGQPGVRDGETFFLPLYTARLTPSFGPITDILSNDNATYTALVASLRAQLPSQLTVRAAYTFSRAIDFGESATATPRTDGQLDPFTNGYDKGLSSLNYPHLLHAAAVWSPEPHLESSALTDLTKDWQLSTLVNARSGRPYTFDVAGGTRLPGGHQSLNGSGGALYLPTVGRNTLRLPPTYTVDLRLARTFRASDRIHLRASAEAFNLFNHRNISSVSQRAFLAGAPVGGITPLVFQNAATVAAEGLNTIPFGAPTAAATRQSQERRIQLSLHATF